MTICCGNIDDRRAGIAFFWENIGYDACKMTDITTTPNPEITFASLGVAQNILATLDKLGFKTPTPIQHQAIPSAIAGKDLMGIAQTGTGKTLAFGLPLLQRLSEGKARRALIVLPTRELAYQVEESLAQFAPALGIRTAVIIGGASMYQQKQDIRRNPRIVVATPGRLNDHLEQKTITLREADILILDEADQMLDMGFMPQIERILKHVPAERQTMLFSATMPHQIVALANKHLKLPLRIEVAPAGTAAEKVAQEMFIVEKAHKMALLMSVLREHPGSVLVFSRTKHGAKKITHHLRASGFTAAEIHSNRSLAQRREALEGFKKAKYRVLVATDIAARGIDVTGITVVVNFDLPDDSSDYVHRIGRTARAGREGLAISFACPDQTGDVRNIEKLIRMSIKRKALPANMPVPPPPPPMPNGGGQQQFNGGGRSHGGSSRGGFRRGGSRFRR
jgi:ATP-dependent RNA helicase RhlE